MVDKIIVRGLKFHSCVGLDRWGKPRPQPVILNIVIGTDVDRAGLTDDVQDTIDYSAVTKDVFSICDAKEFHDLICLVEAVADHILGCIGVEQVSLEAEALNQFRLARSLLVRMVRNCRADDGPPLEARLTIKELCMPVIIGVNHIERQFKQNVITTLTFHEHNQLRQSLDWMMISSELEKVDNRLCLLTTQLTRQEAYSANIIPHS